MAKRTYTGTFFYPDNLKEAEVTLYISKRDRYERGSRMYMANEDPEDEEKIKFKGLTSWAIVEGGEEAELCEKFVDEKDENDEYLILYFADKIEIYRNSHVTMFIH